MLMAEIHGKYVPEAQNFEDYLTSTIFGHLRYVPPGPFWEAFLRRCRSLSHTGAEILAGDYLREQVGTSLGSYESLKAVFWPTHPNGSPDVLLLFTGRGLQPVVICIEAKLFASKSGIGENDQLARYLDACGSLGRMQPKLPGTSAWAVVYLTTHDSRGELLDSLAATNIAAELHMRLYRLQWKDIIGAAEDADLLVGAMSQQILRDVSAFLKARDLDHFAGMTLEVDDVDVDASLFTETPLLSDPDVPRGVEEVHGGWLR